MDLFLGREPCIQNAFSLTLKSGRDSSEDGDNSERQRSERSDSPPYDTMHCLDSPTTEEDRRQSAGLRGELKRPDLKGSFRCSICAKIFCHSSSLSRHRMQAHFKNYKCTLCRKEITSNETLRTHMYKKHHIARMFMCRCCNFAFPDKTTMHMHIHAKEEGKNVSIPVIGKGLTASERLLDPSAFNIPPPTTTTTVISPQLPTSNILPSTLSLPYFSPPSISSVSQAPTSNMSSFVLPEEFAKLRDRLVMNSLFSQQGLGMAAAWLSNLPKPIPTTQPTSNMLSMMRQDEDEEIINVDERENDNLREDKLESEKMPEELKPLSVEGKRLSDSPSSNASLASGDGCSPAHTSSAHSPIVGLFKKDISTPSAFHHLNVDSRPCLEGAGSSPSHVSPSETHSSVSPDGNCYECQVYKTKLVISENKCRYLESRGNTLQSEAVNAQSQASIVESALRTAEIESVGMKQRNELLHRRLIDCQNKCVRFLQETDGISNPQSIMSFVNQIIQTTILQ